MKGEDKKITHQDIKPTPKGVVLVKAWELAAEMGDFGACHLLDLIEETHPGVFNEERVYYYLGQLVEMGEIAVEHVHADGFPLTFKRAEKPWKVYH